MPYLPEATWPRPPTCELSWTTGTAVGRIDGRFKAHAALSAGWEGVSLVGGRGRPRSEEQGRGAGSPAAQLALEGPTVVPQWWRPRPLRSGRHGAWPASRRRASGRAASAGSASIALPHSRRRSGAPPPRPRATAPAGPSPTSGTRAPTTSGAARAVRRSPMAAAGRPVAPRRCPAGERVGIRESDAMEHHPRHHDDPGRDGLNPASGPPHAPCHRSFGLPFGPDRRVTSRRSGRRRVTSRA
jgi:hypothetical protein